MAKDEIRAEGRTMIELKSTANQAVLWGIYRLVFPQQAVITAVGTSTTGIVDINTHRCVRKRTNGSSNCRKNWKLCGIFDR